MRARRAPGGGAPRPALRVRPPAQAVSGGRLRVRAGARVRPPAQAAALLGAFLLWGSPAAGARAQEVAYFGDPAGDGLTQLESPLAALGVPHVLVHLETSRVYWVDGSDLLWSAPAGTGTGFRLAGAGQRWTFSTPRGLFRVRRKEKDPVWIAPDWHFVERGAPVPGPDHRSRRIPGAMGNTAIYLGDGIAIHGTQRPDLILVPDADDRRVSHGCIRLTNEAARELYHMVGVGTPVLIF